MTAASALGTLPEWDLADLYASPEAPEFTADMKKGEELAKASPRNTRASWRRYRALR